MFDHRKIMTEDELQNSKDFFVDAYNARHLAKLQITGYKITSIKVKNIIRYYDDEVSTLYNTDVYRYLSTDQKYDEAYNVYIRKYPAGDHPGRSLADFKKLIKSLDEQGYDIHKGAIFINEYGMILEGQHRCCYYLYNYGPEYELKVVKLYRKFKWKRFIGFSLYRLIWPLLLYKERRENSIWLKKILGGGRMYNPITIPIWI